MSAPAHSTRQAARDLVAAVERLNGSVPGTFAADSSRRQYKAAWQAIEAIAADAGATGELEQLLRDLVAVERELLGLLPATKPERALARQQAEIWRQVRAIAAQEPRP